MNKHKRASVLVLAVWAVFLLSFFAVSIGGLVRQKMTLTQRLQSRQQLYYIAEAGIKIAMKEIRKEDITPQVDALKDLWSNNRELFEKISIDPGTARVSYSHEEENPDNARYGLMDEGQKININLAGAEALKSLLSTIGEVGSDDAERLAYHIIDWRDSDSFFGHPIYGAEDTDYEDLSAPYECKDAPFEAPEELLLVSEISAEVFDKIKNFITVYGEGGININTVPRQVLAIYLPETLVERIIDFRRGDDGVEGTKDDLAFEASTEIVSKLSQAYGLGPSEISTLTAFVDSANPTTASEYFTAHSTAELDRGKAAFEISAVIDKNGQVWHWDEAYKTVSKQ